MKDYPNSSLKYKEAFKINNGFGTVNDKYNAICTWSLNGEIEEAINQLESLAINAKFSNYNHITNDKDLSNLYQHYKWNQILEIIKKNKEKEDDKLNKPLITILDSIYYYDQHYRKQSEALEKKYGANSKEITDLWKIINEKDSVNLITIKNILDTYGWLGTDEIGQQGNATIFLVIQHSDLETQLKYLPMMREAVKKGNAKSSSLALLEDRIALRQGKSQIYGSQIGYDKEKNSYYVLPIIDPDNVNIRRAEVGLPPIETYVNYWQINWNLEQYKKDLPKLKNTLYESK
ncbi:MAG TPA: hypothetical protein PKX92_12310 [Edaphocola sp.]|nr:hypothetical protein [Edaphocola sp.]